MCRINIYNEIALHRAVSCKFSTILIRRMLSTETSKLVDADDTHRNDRWHWWATEWPLEIYTKQLFAREIKSSIEKKRRNQINGCVDNTCITDVSFAVLNLIAAGQRYRDIRISAL